MLDGAMKVKARAVDADWRPGEVVLCHGCFDLLHLGHIRHLKEAKQFGNYLVVSVTTDRHISKGMGRPHFTAEQRAEALRALHFVDEVIINDDKTCANLIRKLKPKYYVKGIDYASSVDVPGFQDEIDAITQVGGELRFTTSQKWSSSSLLKGQKFSEETCRYLDELKKDGAKTDILRAFDEADSKKILFVGETIIDVYKYVHGLGKSSKEMMLASVQTGREEFEGGVLATSKHGEWKNYEVLTHPRSCSITKTRYVDQDFKRKLFDVYSSKEIDLLHQDRYVFRDRLMDAMVDFDVVVVNDFGHGLMGSIETGILVDAPFLAVNCQANAGNYGFNRVTKYQNAKYVCVDEPEARLATCQQKENIRLVAESLSGYTKCDNILITHGRHGSYSYSEGIHSHNPAMVDGGIDTIGAGDAVFAVTAPLVACGLPLSVAAFVGNVVGAIMVSILGHQRHVTREEIIKTVEALLA